MRIVAITACPTGIAHTYMAAEQLAKVARSLGHEIQVETQGAMGIENELSDTDIAAADVVILAADIEVEQRERFADKRVMEISVQDAIKRPGEILEGIEA